MSPFARPTVNPLKNWMTLRGRALRRQCGHSDSGFCKSNYPKVLSVMVREAKGAGLATMIAKSASRRSAVSHTSGVGGSKIACTARIRPLTSESRMER